MRLVSRLLLSLTLVALGTQRSVFAESSSSSAGEATVVYHSAASEVRLVLFATDEHNRTIENLQKDDFAVIDNETVIRDFRSFTRSPEMKLDLVVLIDSSESVVPQIEKQMTVFLQSLAQWPMSPDMSPDDSLSVISFGGAGVRTLCDGNCPAALTPQRIASVPKGGATPLFDAIETAIDLVTQHEQRDRWPAIILLSDGRDTISRASFGEASERIVAGETQIYAIDLSPAGRRENGPAILNKLAEVTGGRYIRSGDMLNVDFHQLMKKVSEDIHSAIVVSYAMPDSTAGFHSVRVLPSRHLAWKFRCRQGYFNRSTSQY